MRPPTMIQNPHRLKAIYNQLKREIHARIDPVGYARSIGVKLGDNVNFYGMRPGMFSTEPWLISIGNNVHVASEVQFITHDGGTIILRNEVPDLEWTAPISIGDNVYIGFRSIIMPGAKIGSRVIIGAGSLVHRNIPNNSVAVGVPAMIVNTVDSYLENMKKKSLCCGHLQGLEKENALKKIFNIHTTSSILK
jgi:acetyltransferase-like isoleucine patch superfamily enzyme